MSIKPVAWMYKHKEKPELVNVTDVRLNPKTRNPLYEEIPLIPVSDTHRVVPLKLTEKMIEAALPQLMREDDEDKYRALGQLICVWDALVEAAKESQCQS